MIFSLLFRFGAEKVQGFFTTDWRFSKKNSDAMGVIWFLSDVKELWRRDVKVERSKSFAIKHKSFVDRHKSHYERSISL